MNYGIPVNPFGIIPENINTKLLEEELNQIKKTLAYLEERIKVLENKEIKKDIPKFMNSDINKNEGFYMI
ncbi:MAG: hypothetical protein IK997_02125 [Bacilli bacterium]|nr:hypothetical protein [Bacilli bacterium]